MAYKKNKKFVKVDNYAVVTDEIIKALESGDKLPWVKPWKSSGSLRNAFTGRAYRGVNTLILGMQPYSDPRWATFNQIVKKGGNVAGQKGTKVILWKFLKDKKDPTKTIPLLRSFTLFNVEQATGLDIISLEELLKKSGENTPTIREDLEEVIADTKAVVKFGGDRAVFFPTTDEINMPTIESFEDDNSFYSTMFHELAHWSGTAGRLNREGIVEQNGFGNEVYAFEELVAELTSAFIGRDLSFDGTFRETHASYIKSWIKVLKNDKRAIFKASSQAEKAAKFIMGKHAPKFEEKEEEAK